MRSVLGAFGGLAMVDLENKSELQQLPLPLLFVTLSGVLSLHDNRHMLLAF